VRCSARKGSGAAQQTGAKKISAFHGLFSNSKFGAKQSRFAGTAMSLCFSASILGCANCHVNARAGVLRISTAAVGAGENGAPA
jgi:hypothetical protein